MSDFLLDLLIWLVAEWIPAYLFGAWCAWLLIQFLRREVRELILLARGPK